MISTLEHAAVAESRTRYFVKSAHCKVHAIGANGRPLCGGGNGAKSVAAWQEDIGPINCQACLNIIKRKNHED